MAFDRSRRSVRCPRCGHDAPAPAACPSCGDANFRYLGAGSERLAEQLAKAFPRARTRRVDPDTLAAGTDAADGAEADIYVTTWIGTKPALRPEVQMVGVLDADALIRRADFRAAENAYQALAEMSEWAGPRSSGGRLVIQTAEASHHAVQAVVRGDYTFFLERELEQRRELAYPPFSELVKLRASGPDPDAMLRGIRDRLRARGVRALGPISVRSTAGDAPGRAAEMLLKARDAATVSKELRVILPDVPAGSRLKVDVDPR